MVWAQPENLFIVPAGWGKVNRTMGETSVGISYAQQFTSGLADPQGPAKACLGIAFVGIIAWVASGNGKAPEINHPAAQSLQRGMVGLKNIQKSVEVVDL
jgi:hypothetical protein